MSNARQKYGMTIDSFLGDTNAAGALQAPSVGGVLQSNDITGIGDSAWHRSFNKANITGLSLPNLASIGSEGLKEAFDGNQFLKTLNLPSLTTVNVNGMNCAFQNSGLTNVTGLSHLTSVGESGMSYCFNGTQISGDIDLSSLTTIGNDGLSLCFFGTRIASVDLSKLTTVWGGALANAFAYSTVRSIDFSGMVNMITQEGWGNTDYMCQNCTSLTSVDFSNLVTATSFHHCFEGCSSLVEIDFPKLTTIGQPNESWGELLAYMFSGCSSLKIVRFPKLSTIIGSTSESNDWNYTFYNCTALETIDFSNATAVPPLGWNHDDSEAMPFKYTNSTFKILVPNGLYDQWIVADGWSDSEIRPHIERATKGTVFIANEPGTITLVKNASSSQATADLEYSTDLGATWNTYTVGTSLTFNARLDQIWFRAGTTGNPNGLRSFHFTGTGTWVCASDLGYLLSRNGIAASTQLPENCFAGLFNNCTSLIGVSSDALPFTNLSSGCYMSMFEGCSNLYTSAPDLPATNVPGIAYRYMFKGCSRLATPPAIEGTTFGTQSCAYMFQNCTSLTTMPELKATNLASAGKYYCFQNMFDGCSSLTSAALLATTVGNGCYRYIFSNCSNLNEITLGYMGNFDSAFDYWVDGVAASGTLYYNGTDTTTGTSAIPIGWTVQNFNQYDGLTFEALQNGTVIEMASYTSAPSLQLEYSTNGRQWNTFTVGSTQVTLNSGGKVFFRGTNAKTANSFSSSNNRFVISSGSANVMGNVCSVLDQDNYDTMTSLPTYAIQGLFQDCTGLIDASGMVMKAGNLGDNCCGHLFDGCSDLEKGAEFFVTQTGSWSMEYIYRNCSSLTEAYLHYTGSWSQSVFQNWMSGVAAGGTLYTDNQNVPAGASGCPSGWTIQSFS